MLCREVFPTTRELTRNNLFGLYLHHLCAHAPQQYEIVPLRSINTEHEEHLFGQAKLNASNRQPENAIFNIFVRQGTFPSSSHESIPLIGKLVYKG